jgi:hypothetical protein
MKLNIEFLFVVLAFVITVATLLWAVRIAG